jgi:hypothetical protein
MKLGQLGMKPARRGPAQGKMLVQPERGKKMDGPAAQIGKPTEGLEGPAVKERAPSSFPGDCVRALSLLCLAAPS